MVPQTPILKRGMLTVRAVQQVFVSWFMYNASLFGLFYSEEALTLLQGARGSKRHNKLHPDDNWFA